MVGLEEAAARQAPELSLGRVQRTSGSELECPPSLVPGVSRLFPLMGHLLAVEQRPAAGLGCCVQMGRDWGRGQC